MELLKEGDIWELPSGREVALVCVGPYDVELRYMDSRLGESFFVLRTWLLTFGINTGDELEDEDDSQTA